MAEFTQANKIKPTAQGSRFFDFIERYWLVLIGLTVAVPYIIRWVTNLKTVAKDAQQQSTVQQQVNNSKASAKENALQNQTIIKQKSDTVLKGYSQQIKDRLDGVAQKLAYALGTTAGKAWYNPTTWTEDDSEIAKLLTDNWFYINKLADLYQKVYTESRNLRIDVLSNLDPSDYAKVKKYYKSKGSAYFA